MTDTARDLRCPECEGPITAAQLASEGLCADCITQAEDSVSAPGEASHAPVSPGATDPDNADTLDDAATPDDDGSDPGAVFADVMGTIAGIVAEADRCRAIAYQLGADELAQPVGGYLDAVAIQGAELLEWVEALTAAEGAG